MQNNDLKKLIKKLYGSQLRCATILNVSTQSVQNWCSRNPRAMLKHAPEIVHHTDTTWTQLAAEVLNREQELNI